MEKEKFTELDLKVGSLVSFGDYSSEAFFIEQINKEEALTPYYSVVGLGGKNGSWVNPIELVEGIFITPETLEAIGIESTPHHTGRSEFTFYNFIVGETTFRIIFNSTNQLVRIDSEIIRKPERQKTVPQIHFYYHISYMHELQQLVEMVSGTRLEITEEQRILVSDTLN